MASLLERVRDALAPHYDVERQLGAGGMGVELASAGGRTDVACVLASRVGELWSDADREYAAPRRQAGTLAKRSA